MVAIAAGRGHVEDGRRTRAKLLGAGGHVLGVKAALRVAERVA